MKETDIYRMIQEIVAEHIAQNIAMPEAAVVTSVDITNYTVKCQLAYDDVIVGPLRICESYAGTGFGITNMPETGDEVMVVFQGGRLNDGFVVGRLYGPDNRPPVFNYGDWLMRHKSGSSMKFNVAGDVITQSKEGATAAKSTLGQDGTIKTENAQGSSTIKPNGDIELKNGLITMALKSTGEVRVTNGQATFDMNQTGQFAIKNAAGNDLLQILNDMIQDMITAAPAFTAVGVLNPALVTQLTALQVQLTTLKQ